MLFRRITIGGLEWIGRLIIMWLTWPFKYFTIKRVIFAMICFAAGIGAVGAGLINVADKQCFITSEIEFCFLVFPIDAQIVNFIK